MPCSLISHSQKEDDMVCMRDPSSASSLPPLSVSNSRNTSTICVVRLVTNLASPRPHHPPLPHHQTLQPPSTSPHQQANLSSQQANLSRHQSNLPLSFTPHPHQRHLPTQPHPPPRLASQFPNRGIKRTRFSLRHPTLALCMRMKETPRGVL